MKIIVVRHGQTEWNALGKLQGRTDVPLNEAGKNQAKMTAELLADKKIDAVICSPLIRARQTAEIISEGRGLSISTDDGIAERDFGKYEGWQLKYCHLNERWDEIDEKDGGESTGAFVRRVFSFLDRLINQNPAENVLLVCHGGVSAAVACYFSGSVPKGPEFLKLVPPNCAVSEYNTEKICKNN